MSHNLKFTKFFDVKSPIGIGQRESQTPFQSIGIDLYMPRPSIVFVDEILKANKHFIIVNAVINKVIPKYYESFDLWYKGNMVIEFSEKYYIHKKIQIPLGIGIIIPEGYHIDLRSKSSNFSNDLTQVTGLIDEDYTHGFGLQLLPLEDTFVVLDVDQKVSQIVMLKSEKIMKLEEIIIDDWEDLNEVAQRRISRNGGFGVTGKFDK